MFGRKAAGVAVAKTPAFDSGAPELPEKYGERDPYILAREEYYDRYGRTTKDLARWRTAAFVMTFLVFASVAASIFMAFSVKVIPYIVQVDKHGYEIAITQAPQTTPFEQKVIISRLGRFILDMRTIIMDTTAQRRLITGLYTMIPSGQTSYMKLNEYFRQNNPLEAAGKGQTQEVEIRSILHLDGNTWQIEWTEKRYEKGIMTREQAWRGFVTIALNPTRDLQNIIDNPLGVYVLDFNFSPNLNQDLKRP
jgi:type IV secretion system protein VirB5